MNNERLLEIDFARGLALLIMFFAHIDEKINPFNVFGEGLNGTYPLVENTYSFIIRLVQTPTVMAFFLLAGMSIGIQLYASQNEKKKLPQLINRGIQLVFIQLTLVSFAWWLLYSNQDYFITVGVLAGFGFAFMAMHVLVRFFSAYSIGIIGIMMLLIRELFPVSLTNPSGGVTEIVARTIFVPGYMDNIHWYYPAYSWLAVIMIGCAFGYCYCNILKNDSFSAYKIWIVAVSGLVLWYLSRLSISFGNFFQEHNATMYEIFLPSKYPPSVSFVVLGTLLSLTWLLVGRSILVQEKCNWIIFLGQNSLTSYVLHLYVLAWSYYVINFFHPALFNSIFAASLIMFGLVGLQVYGIIYYKQRNTS